MSGVPAAPAGIGTVFVYWGRRGSLSLLALNLAKVLRDRPDLMSILSFSSSNELASELAALPDVAAPIDTFRAGAGALLQLPGFLRRGRNLVADWQRRGIRHLVILMPHVWTPILTRFARAAGMRTTVIVHDARRHPGDHTATVQGWLMSDLHRVDRIVTLSRAVAIALKADRPHLASRITTLFHPLLSARGPYPPAAPTDRLRVLWFGRVMRYKGLPLLVEAAQRLAAEHVPVALTVAGEGDLSGDAEALRGLGASVRNYWLDHAEIERLLAGCDVVVLPYVAASQSGVTAVALGAGRPVVVTPVGGLAEQVSDGVDGLVCAGADAGSLADALRLLAGDRALLRRLQDGAMRTACSQSVEAFAAALAGVEAHPSCDDENEGTGRCES